MQQFKVAVILLVCGLYATSVVADGCTDDGFYVDEQNCQKYHQCAEGRRYDFKCNDGLNFDTKTFVCVWPKDATCKNSGEKQTTWAPNSSTEAAPLTEDCPKGDGRWVVEDDCTRFYGCAGGVRHYFNCPSGMKYNTESGVCVEPADAKCTN